MLVQLSSAEIGISRQKLLQIPLILARNLKLHQSVKTKINQKQNNIENLCLPTDNVALNHVGNFKNFKEVFLSYICTTLTH